MKPLRVLIVEDSEQDVVLVLRELRKAGYSPVHMRVDTAGDLATALEAGSWDIVISDHSMPGFDSLSALRILRQKGLDLPFIIVSGTIGEDVAVKAMKDGAHDYIMKGNLKRLGPAIERELEEAANLRQRKKAEQELKKKEEELRLAKKIEAIKDEFIGMVSHELKTPLTVVIGSLRLAETERVDREQARGLIHEAAVNAESLASMLDNLLELSRHQSDRLSLSTKKTRIEPVIRTVVEKLRSKSGIHHLEVDIPPKLPGVMIDTMRIETVLYNLIENAIKYSPNGGEVRVFARQQGGQLIIGVSDNGIGISPEVQGKLFQSFQRLDVEERHNIAGVGLGLRVCSILVEAHKGKIWVESEPDKGSTFFFSVPLPQQASRFR